MNIRQIYDELTIESIQEYIDINQEENLNIDFKILSGGNTLDRDDRKNLARALSGFSNSNGGIIIWGVDCRKNEDRVDCASDIKEIENVDIVINRLNEYTGTAVNPIVDGVLHKKIYTSESKGVIATYIPESDAGPHMAKLSEDRYYKRSGDSFYKMEHFDIADMFGKRRKPILSLDFIPKAPHRIIIRIRNDGRGSAIAPYLKVWYPHMHAINEFGVDGNGNWNLPRMHPYNDHSFGGTSQHVIHPGTIMDIFILQRLDNMAINGPLEIKYAIAAEDFPLTEGKLILPCEDEIKTINANR